MTQVFDSRIQQSEQSILRTEEEMLKLTGNLLMSIKNVMKDLLKFFEEGQKEKKAEKLADIANNLQKIEEWIKESIGDNEIIPPKMRENIAKLREQVNKCQKQLADGKDISSNEMKRAKMLLADVTRDSYKLKHEINQLRSQLKQNQSQNPASKLNQNPTSSMANIAKASPANNLNNNLNLPNQSQNPASASELNQVNQNQNPASASKVNQNPTSSIANIANNLNLPKDKLPEDKERKPEPIAEVDEPVLVNYELDIEEQVLEKRG